MKTNHRSLQVCILKAQGLLVESVQELHKILSLYPTEERCWLELGEIHLTVGDYQVQQDSS
jgi:hypothetical protein